MNDHSENQLVAQNKMMLAVQAMDNIERIADLLSKSNVIPWKLKGKKDDIAVILLYGNELDLSPMQALTEIYVINGIPSISGKLMLSRIYNYAKGYYINWKERGPSKVVLEMARDHSKNGLFESTWTLEKATKRGLINKDNWKNNPEMMMTWRCVSECARIVFPDIIKGYTRDELEEGIEVDYKVVDKDEKEKEELDKKLKEGFEEIEIKFTAPNEVESTSGQNDLPDDPDLLIKMQIPNRDWKLNTGSDKGKSLYEFSINDLESRLKNITNTLNKRKKLNSKLSIHDDTNFLIQNLTAYCEKYREIESKLKEESESD